MNRHATAADLQLYVIDALGPVPRRWLEEHLGGCSPCAEALTAEAALETELVDLWPALRRPLADVVPLRPPAPRTVARPARALVRASGSGFGAAAVALLFLGWWADGGRAGAPSVSSPLACLAPGFCAAEPARDEAAICRPDDRDRLSCAPGPLLCAAPADE